MLNPIIDHKDVPMSQRCATRYPLVLVPGMLGFIRLVLYPYWYGIISALRRGRGGGGGEGFAAAFVRGARRTIAGADRGDPAADRRAQGQPDRS
ncbi:protein of unknown function [Pseudomonas mediterranea]